MKKLRISGVYPHLAVTHSKETSRDCGECGIGAVVLFHGKLYFVTYPGHSPYGGDGRVYSVDENLVLTELPESTGGTHADRLISKETGKLVIGANVIDPDGTVKAFDINQLCGRLTGATTHPRADEGYVYIASMEEALYEANLNTMEVTKLRDDICYRFFRKGFERLELDFYNKKVLGDHGKGVYSGQGVLLYSNNGHGGSLTEWDMKSDASNPKSWKLIEHAKFTEITGPGGIYGERNSDDPIWALGWDERSVLLNVRCDGKWHRYRLPKSSYTQDADNGWFTEWPRIRQVGDKYLMCMHGLLYEFPESFKKGNAAGIKPIASHLKMIADFEKRNDEIVFACDDASHFGNPVLNQCQSNLWFSSFSDLYNISEPIARGGVFTDERVIEGQTSDPFFIGGFDEITMFLTAHAENGCFIIEYDSLGNDDWKTLDCVEVKSDKCEMFRLNVPNGAQWIRVRVDRDYTECTAYLYMRQSESTVFDSKLTDGLSSSVSNGKLAVLEGEDMRLGYLSDNGYYVIDEELNFTPSDDTEEINKTIAIAPPKHDPNVKFTGHSVLLIDEHGQKYHLPFTESQKDCPAVIKEIVTERSLMNICGTVFEYPRPESGGVRRVRPITTHKKAISDMVSWRGLLVLSGTEKDAKGEHIFTSSDSKASLWMGNVDDLWRMGTPSGIGGALCDTPLYEGEASDPFLVADYREKSVKISHNCDFDLTVKIEADFAATGHFSEYSEATVKKGECLNLNFPSEFTPHWVRFRATKDCKITTVFELK